MYIDALQTPNVFSHTSEDSECCWFIVIMFSNVMCDFIIAEGGCPARLKRSDSRVNHVPQKRG